jgi:glycosyltransferase involved in cell wall biosynthesis
MKILSVILPTYNVERFIEDCIRSVEEQDIDRRHYEIVVVDDGATDGSAARVLELQQEYENIILLRQMNAGLSAARNRGIRAAKGKYLLLIDPDDRVEKNCFAAMLAAAESHEDIDFVGFSYNIHYNSGLVTTQRVGTLGPAVIGGVEYYEKLVAGDYHIWRYLFSREFLIRNNLFFLDGILFEDVEFLPRLMYTAQRAACHDLAFYHYHLRPGSISTVNSAKHITSRLIAAENLHRFKLEKAGGLSSEARMMFDDVVAECLLSAVSSSHDFPSLLGSVSKQIRCLPFYPMELAEGSRHRREMGILNRSIQLFWIYSYASSMIGAIRRKIATAAAIARGPAAAAKFIDYLLRVIQRDRSGHRRSAGRSDR